MTPGAFRDALALIQRRAEGYDVYNELRRQRREVDRVKGREVPLVTAALHQAYARVTTKRVILSDDGGDDDDSGGSREH